MTALDQAGTSTFIYVISEKGYIASDRTPPEVILNTSTYKRLDSCKKVWEMRCLFWEAIGRLKIGDSITMEEQENRYWEELAVSTKD